MIVTLSSSSSSSSSMLKAWIIIICSINTYLTINISTNAYIPFILTAVALSIGEPIKS